MTLDAPLRGRALGPLDALRLPLLVALGLLLGVWGAFLVPTGPRVGAHLLSAGAAVAIVGNPIAVRLGQRAVPRFGGAALVAGWAAVAIAFSLHRSNGSVVLPGSGDLATPALVYVIGGMLAGVVAAVVRTRR